MRIIFYNPQMSVVVGTTLYNFTLKIFSYGKYWHLFKNKPCYQNKFYIFIDSNGTSLLPKWLGKILTTKAELYLWLIINHINPFNVVILNKPEQVKKNDIIIGFSVGLLDYPKSNLETLKKIQCIKIFHLTHFIQRTKLISKNAEDIKVNYFVAENNLYKNSPYFRKHFRWYKKDVYTLPFAFQDRFISQIPFSKRKSKAMAIGTMVDITTTQSAEKFEDFTSFFNTKILQPIRYKIYLKKNKLKLYIDSFIGELYETKPKTDSKTLLERIKNAISNSTKATKRKYFSFDMTKTFNKYMMFINGEEINNLPGIGFVEGMACGCAYIGKNDLMYKDIGLISGKHFIAHNGQLSDITKQIIKYQNNPEMLELIANNGYRFVRKNFSGTSVSRNFFDDLYQLSIDKKKLYCSFTNQYIEKDS